MRSIVKHNVRIDILCDWIEANSLFTEAETSRSDVADTLVEQQVYVDISFALELVNDAWSELNRRSRWINNGYAFDIDSEWVRLKSSWRDYPAHSFCVILSLAPYYSWWTSVFGSDYSEQGELFEWLTELSFKAQFNSWETYRTGWSRLNPVGLAQVVREITNRLGEQPGRLDIWNDSMAKEKGLDLLCYRPFPDNRVGTPIYLMQCASGANWDTKLKTPDLELWRSIIQFSTMPKRAFSVPFSFADKEFTQNCILNDGLFLERCRLLCASNFQADWISEALKERLIAWTTPRIRKILERSD